MSRFLLKDGRTVDGETIIDFDATHTNPVSRLTAQEYLEFVESAIPDPPPAPPAPPFLVPPRVVAAALDMVVTPENWDISNGSGMFNIVGAAYMMPGIYWMFPTEAFPDSDYFAIITGASVARAEMTDHDVDYFVIEARDGSGVLADTGKLSVQIYRISP